MFYGRLLRYSLLAVCLLADATLSKNTTPNAKEASPTSQTTPQRKAADSQSDAPSRPLSGQLARIVPSTEVMSLNGGNPSAGKRLPDKPEITRKINGREWMTEAYLSWYMAKMEHDQSNHEHTHKTEPKAIDAINQAIYAFKFFKWGSV